MSLTPTAPDDSQAATALLALTAEPESAPAAEAGSRATAILRVAAAAELAVVLDGEISAAAGGGVSAQFAHRLLTAVERGRDHAMLSGGEVTLAAAPLHGSGSWLVVARHGPPFAAQDPELVTGAARVLALY
ncbi:MAG: hypothetical protein M3Y09_16445, partial [Actinomycetota bacterium]|nr:hypothetical protein [Actinomycetota bacterium]